MLDLLSHEPGIYAYDAHFVRPGLAAVHLVVERERDAGPARGARLLAGLRAQAESEAARQGWRPAAGPLRAPLDGFLDLAARALDGWLAQTAPEPSA